MRNSDARAFTMIELLNVVAVIAILAAIAVPNFLEAQVRSKIARTRQDMAVVQAALRAYGAQYDAFPPNSPWVTARLVPYASVGPNAPLPANFPNGAPPNMPCRISADRATVGSPPPRGAKAHHSRARVAVR